MKSSPSLDKLGLSIPEKYAVELSKSLTVTTGLLSQTEQQRQQKCFLLAVHNSWIRQVISEKKVPKKFILHDTLNDDQINAFLRQGALENFGSAWNFVHLTAIVTLDETKLYRKLQPKQRQSMLAEPATLPCGQSKRRLLPKLNDFIGEANFNYIWQQPSISYLENSAEPAQDSMQTEELVHSTEDTYLQILLDTLYNISQRSNDLIPQTLPLTVDSSATAYSISNLAQPLAVLKVHKNVFLIFHLHSYFTLQDCVNFSPEKLLSSNVKILFIIYQILQFIHDMEANDIPIGDITLSSIWTDESLFVSIRPNIGMIFNKLEFKKSVELGRPQIDDTVQAFLTTCVERVRLGILERLDEEHFDSQIVESVIRLWCEGLITNFDYLMFLNYLCGRVCNINPNYHPVFPWVSDFSVQNGGWRDLTKSKFRINKGERQLTLMFEEKSSITSIPHHITDVLSEITYYVYKARQTSKEILCKFVRPKWVPAEYPVSIQRIYDWSPDECVPEFFFDANIFKSIHADLADLLPPAWCSSPEEFIRMHRELLESDQVSSKLHHWIDHTFGYKLVGSAAVKSKNVYLSLVDKHEHLLKTGIVQLFQTPHPPRRNRTRDSKNFVSYAELKKMRENDLEKETEFITLPRHYDPMGFLNDFEVSLNFFKTHFNSKAGVQLVGIPAKETPRRTSDYVKLFGCLLIELTFPTKVQHIVNAVKDIDKRFEFYHTLMDTLEPVPLFIKRTIQAIFSPDSSFNFSVPLDISTTLLLLAGDLSPLPFPKYFDQFYKLVSGLRSFDAMLSVADPLDVGFRQKVDEVRVKSFSKDFVLMINEFDEEGLELVLPFILDLFKNPSTRVLAVWNLFCPFARALGRKKAVQTLMDPIIQIYESDYNSDKHLKLFHRSFLLQLQSCFGLRPFLDNFSTLIIEPIGGWKHLEDGSSNARPTHLKNCFEDIEIPQINDAKVPRALSQERPSQGSDQECDDSSSSHEVETDIFVMEPELSDSEDSAGPGSQPASAEHTREISVDDSRECYANVPSRDSTSSYDSRSNKSCTANDITEMCCESIIWLVHRLGPVLCAKYISKNLLRMLTLCYLGHFDEDSRRQSSCNGNAHAESVHECLLAINDLYGNCFIERQYILYCVEVVNSAGNRMSSTLEAALIGVASLLEKIVNYIDDAVLVGLLNDTLLIGLLKPMVGMGTSLEVTFPSGSGPRMILIEKILNMTSSIRNKIGPDISQQILKPLVLQLCARFQNTLPESEETSKVKQNLHLVFNKSLAHRIFTNFYEMLVGSEYESMIQDLFLLQTQVQIPVKDSSPSCEKDIQRKKIESQSSFGSRSFGNKIMVHEHDSTYTGHDSTSSPNSARDTTRHIRGNWLVYWEHEIGRSDTKFYFKQIKLQTFSGHSASVRSIWSLNNENSFLTGSKDRTCKVFSLRNQGDESVTLSHKWTYTHHKRAVLNVLFNEQLHLAASTDGRIHLWDPFMGKHIRILDTKSICCLKPAGDSCNIIGAGTEYCVVVDPRTCHGYELKMGIGQNMGMVRCMSVASSGNIVSVGHSSGMLSSLDLRNGTLMGSWKGHEGEILQLITHNDRYLISSSLDQNLLVWNIDDNKLAFQMRGPTEPVISMATLNSDLITCSTSNRIGVHGRIDINSDFSSTKLRSDTCKGTVTTFNLLPLNQALLVGSDTGLVYLIC